MCFYADTLKNCTSYADSDIMKKSVCLKLHDLKTKFQLELEIKDKQRNQTYFEIDNAFCLHSIEYLYHS